MNEVTRLAILRSNHRGMRLLAHIDEGKAETITIDREELHTLLLEHAFLCGLALQRERETRRDQS
jgi:hypothetical protein